MTEDMQDKLVEIVTGFSGTEDADVSHFMRLWRQCVNDDQKHYLVKSFRRQMLQVAIAEMLLESAA